MIRLFRRSLLASGMLACLPAMAAPVFHPAGTNLTHGAASNGDTVFAATANPAATSLAIDPDARVRMGLLPNAGAGYEVGPVDGFADEVDDLIDLLDADFATVNEAQDAADRFNAILPEIGRDGYVKAYAAGHVPLFPLMVRTDGLLGGVWSFDISFAGEGWAGILDDPVTVDTVNLEAQSNTAAYVKGAEITEFAVGHSRSLFRLGPGEVFVGGRIKYIQMALSKQVVLLESVEDDDDFADVVRDGYEENQEEGSGITADAGLTWASDSLRLGFSVANLTEPEFDYGPVGFNCNDITDSVQRDNCFAAVYFADRIAREESHVLERQATVSAGLSLFGGSLALSASHDLNEINDPVGTRYQWSTVAAGFQPRTWWVPGLRLGYRQNNAGSELSMVTAGATLFRVIRLDVGYGLEDVTYEDETYPRTAAVNLSVEAQF
ncbi:conjugal transfer protein TraF [Ectothiorhodospiraceae bacterium WFHF3C12]|nr:conjugal transfer protein TraF [Ectothiorhodospiraceae bacterium WFHF3C12]